MGTAQETLPLLGAQLISVFPRRGNATWSLVAPHRQRPFPPPGRRR
jgi:hypothetical protein